MTNIYSSQLASNFNSLEIDYIRAPVRVNCGISANSNDSYGVSSLTDVGTGRLGVSFSRIFSNTSFIAQGNLSKAGTGGNNLLIMQDTANLSTTRCDFFCFLGAYNDPTTWNVSIYGT